MANADPDFTDPERCYRRGFTHGARAVIDAVRDKLPAHEAEKLEIWFEYTAREWRLELYRNPDKRTRDERGDLAPGMDAPWIVPGIKPRPWTTGR